MPEPKVSLKTRQVGPQVWIIDIEGEVTASAEEALMAAYNQASAGDARAILLNFAGLHYMNSSGIGLLVTLLIRTQRQEQCLGAVQMGEHYRQIFSLTRLDEAISIYETEAEALAALNAA